MAVAVIEVRKRKIGADVINSGNVVRDGTKAEGAVTDQFDLVVETFQSSKLHRYSNALSGWTRLEGTTT
jgi:hypothetical protein